jgi:hypothetical protein
MPIARWEFAGSALCAALFLFLRLPLYVEPGILLGWHSDAALLGLMAQAIVRGDYPLVFWASDYLAPLTSAFAALAGGVIGEVGPLALRLGVAVEFIAAILFFQYALRYVTGRAAALMAAFWLTAGPAFMFQLSYAPLSAEAYFFIGAIVFWYVVRRPVVRLHQLLLLGLLAGAGWWIHRGVSFVVVPALVVIGTYDQRQARIRDVLAGAGVFTAGAALGWLPALIGRYGLDQRSYAPVRPPWSLALVQTHLTDLIRYDFWSLIGAGRTPLGLILGLSLVVLLARAIRHFDVRRETLFATGILAVTFAFWIVSTDSYRGAVRYMMIAVPILYAFAAREIVHLWHSGSRSGRWIAISVTLAISAALFVPRYDQVRNVVAARAEQYENWPGGFDPRPALSEIAAGGYSVCYADVWIAHKLEWLSPTDIRIIPYRSVNRRMVESLRLASLPGPKCLIDDRGNVRPLTAREEVEMRLDILWQAHGWRRSLPDARGTAAAAD